MSDLQSVFGQGGFVTNSVAPAADFSFVPPGKYPVVIEQSEMKPTKAGNGHYVELVLVILEGEFQGRKVWDRIQIDNPSEQCREIGRARLAALGLALGIATLTVAQQLANQSVVAHVKVKKEQNGVRTYSSMSEYRSAAVASVVPVQMPSSQPAPAQPPTHMVPHQSDAVPWARPPQ